MKQFLRFMVVVLGMAVGMPWLSITWGDDGPEQLPPGAVRRLGKAVKDDYGVCVSVAATEDGSRIVMVWTGGDAGGWVHV